MWGDNKFSLFAHTDAQQTFVPALDDMADSELECQRLAAFATAIFIVSSRRVSGLPIEIMNGQEELSR